MPDIALFPYLQLGSRLNVGAWELVPRHLLTEEDATAASTLDAATKHLALYKLPAENRAALRCGAFAKPPGGKIGATFNRSDLAPLHLAVVAALLDQNPDRSSTKFGDRVSTSDNALIFAHPINEDGHVAVEHGFMVRTLLGGIHAGEDNGAIYHPAELHLPLFGCSVDGEYASVLHDLLIQNDDQARRLATVIEWLDISWRNTTSISQNLRILALRSGFESLLNVGDNVDAGRAALSALLDPPNVQKSQQTYKTRKGELRTIAVSSLEWWFTSFVFLRNKIAHGGAIPDADWNFNGIPHLHIAAERLREALKKTVANLTGKKDLLLPPNDRQLRRIVAQAFAQVEGATTGKTS